MKHPETDTISPGLYWGKEDQTASAHVLLMIGTVMSHNSVIPSFVDNPVSCAKADGNGSMLSAPSG